MEAEKYRLEKLAEANKKRVILEAEAESEAVSKWETIEKINETYPSFSFRSASGVKQKHSRSMPRQRLRQNKWQRKLRPSESTVSFSFTRSKIQAFCFLHLLCLLVRQEVFKYIQEFFFKLLRCSRIQLK